MSEVTLSGAKSLATLSFLEGEEKAFKIKYTSPSGTTFRRLVYFTRKGEELWLSYQYDMDLTNELKKTFNGMKWHGREDPPVKQWSISYSPHNLFQIAYLGGLNPYKHYDKEISPHVPKRPLKKHQVDIVSFILARKRCIVAAEMGTGKSLCAIEAIDTVAPPEAWMVSTGSALHSLRLECQKWDCKTPIRFMTYDGLKKVLRDIAPGTLPPKFLILDESQKVKTVTSQRSTAAQYLADNMREVWGDDCYIVLLTGSPAPKSPVDWFSQCQIACPGFLKEGNQHMFKERLAVIVKRENQITGGVYPELVSWRDDVTKCHVCGEKSDHFSHDEVNLDRHDFIPMRNEVEYLYKRMHGLVTVVMKKDCLDLPDKIYRKIYCKPSKSIERAAKMIAKVSSSAIQSLTLLRELSDGFQYTEIENGKVTCDLCHGNKQIVQPVYIGPSKTKEFLVEIGVHVPEGIDPEDIQIDPAFHPKFFTNERVVCTKCNGEGETVVMTRSCEQIPSAKDKAMIDLLDEYEDVGRLVVYAGFQASVDRVVEIGLKQQWEVIRVDGRGWHGSPKVSGNPEGMIKSFQDKTRRVEKILFVGNAGSAGTGITLTESPAIVYYSNDFKAESRIQSEDRIHRIGMDTNRGATIIDLIHLPSDEYVLNNLQEKKDLQNMSLGQVLEALEQPLERVDYE